MGCGVLGLGCRVWGVGCRVWGVGFGVKGCRVWGLGFGVWGVGCGVQGVGLEGYPVLEVAPDRRADDVEEGGVVGDHAPPGIPRHLGYHDIPQRVLDTPQRVSDILV